jgi:hypothetical protein
MRRRLTLGSVLVLASTVLALGAPPSQADEPPKVAFGARTQPASGQKTWQAAAQFEAQLGRKLGVNRLFFRWDQTFPDADVNWMVANRRTMLISVKARRSDDAVVTWSSIAGAKPGSSIHNQIVQWATRVKNVGQPIYFTFNHEPEAATNLENGTNTDFIAAWRKVITVFRARGVTNAKYVWITTDYSFWINDRRKASLWYPGDSYVDHIGADAYNWHTCRPGITNAWKSLQQIIDPLRRFGLAHPAKGLMLPEWASAEDPNQPGRKAAWIDEARALFKKPGWEQFVLISYFNHNPVPKFAPCTWPVNSSATAFASFKAMANDPYYTQQSGSAPPASRRPAIRR